MSSKRGGRYSDRCFEAHPLDAPVGPLKAYRSSVTCLAFDPQTKGTCYDEQYGGLLPFEDRNELAAGGRRGASSQVEYQLGCVHIWDIVREHIINHNNNLGPAAPDMNAADDTASSLAYSSDGSQLAIGCINGSAWLINFDTWDNKHVPQFTHSDSKAAVGVAFSHNNTKLLTYSNDCIAVWDLSRKDPTSAPIAKIGAASGDLIRGAAFAKDDATIVALCSNAVRTWSFDVAEGKQLTEFKVEQADAASGGDPPSCQQGAVCPEGRLVAAVFGSKVSC